MGVWWGGKTLGYLKRLTDDCCETMMPILIEE